MRSWPDFAARMGIVTFALGVGAIGAGTLLRIRGVVGAGWALFLLGVAVLSASRFSRTFWRRTGPTIDPNDTEPRLRVARDGSFEWQPVGQPVPYAGYATRPPHRWWDAERGGAYTASVAFDVPDDVSPRDLRAATGAGLRAASAALPARGKVRASAAARDEPGPTSLVKVRLRVQGVGATSEWARVASEAFAARFHRALASHGHVVRQR